MVRDDVMAALSGAVMIGNSALRVVADVNAGLAHLVLRYIDWLSRQLLPDSAEKDWLDRHGDIWLVNSDGSVGRKDATFATGIVTMTGTAGLTIASGTQFAGFGYEATQQIILAAVPTQIAIRALNGGAEGNLSVGDTLDLADSIPGVNGTAIVVFLDGGADAEIDDDLRARVLFRIQEPPMGGDANDYVAWALAVPGVTRAWSSIEMGIGTVTVRFMMDDLRALQNGFPNADDILTVTNYINSVRPVSIKDLFVVAPVPFPIDFRISDLTFDLDSTRAAIEISVVSMLRRWAAPAHNINGVQQDAQMIFASWVSDAILQASRVESFTLAMVDQVMPYNGSLAVLGTIVYDNS
jgi:uncharacterized phage protein gp47/JayE